MTLLTRLRGLRAGKPPAVPEAPPVQPAPVPADDPEIRGLRHLRLGADAEVVVEPPVVFMRPITFKKRSLIGAFTYLNSGFVDHLAEVGRYCSIGQEVRIGEPNHPIDWLSSSSFQHNAGRFGWHPSADAYETRSLIVDGVHLAGSGARIGNDVWIGARVTILRDVTIGDGAVVAAGAVVVKDVDPYTVVGGVPARTLRKRFPEATEERLRQVRWWEYAPNDLSGASFEDIDAAVAFVESLREADRPTYRPEPRVLTRTVLRER